MDLFEAIERRHSYRGALKDVRVPRKDLRRIVEAGIRAPSGCNAQTTSFVIVDDPALLTPIAALLAGPVFRDAKAMIVCVVENRDVFQGMAFGPEDCAAAVENMLLAITALGYATVWTDGALRREDRAGRIGDLLGVPTDRVVRVILPIGVPVETLPQRDRKPFAERAGFNRYGSPE
jgi:nitroreductase